MFSFFSSDIFNFELTRILGATPTSGCDIAEFLDAISKIKKHDPESWYRAWNEQGERAERIGNEAMKSGHEILARNAYLRAANYFRASPYMLIYPDARILFSAGRSIKNFEKALPLMEGEVSIVRIPYEDQLNLPGYLYLPALEKRVPGKIPVLLTLCGADSSKEEMHFMFGDAGQQMGFAVLTFEGPGQGYVLKKNNKAVLRPDFEVCSGKALDFLFDLAQNHPELDLDLDRIAVVGASMGGYFALRAATDPRIKACISIDPFFSLWELALTRMPNWYANLWLAGWVSEGFFNWSLVTHARTNFPTRWEFSLGKWMMGVDEPASVLRRFQEFSLDTKKDGKILEKILCPVLVTGAGLNMYASAETSTLRIHRLLSKVPESEKETWVPSEGADGGLTGKVGAWPLLTQKSFCFLDKHFGIVRQRKN